MAMRTRNCNMIIIDSDKLRAELMKRNLNLTDASLAINLNKNYLSSACRSNRISGLAMYALSQKFNIRKEDIIKDTTTPPSLLIKSEIDRNIIDVNNNELFHIIYRATLKAMKEALNG